MARPLPVFLAARPTDKRPRPDDSCGILMPALLTKWLPRCNPVVAWMALANADFRSALWTLTLICVGGGGRRRICCQAARSKMAATGRLGRYRVCNAADLGCVVVVTATATLTGWG